MSGARHLLLALNFLNNSIWGLEWQTLNVNFQRKLPTKLRAPGNLAETRSFSGGGEAMPISEAKGRSAARDRDCPQRGGPFKAAAGSAGPPAVLPKALQRSGRAGWVELRVRSQSVSFPVVML